MNRVLNCGEAHRFIEEALDDDLDERSRLDLDAHLAQCPSCQQFCRSAGTVREILEAQPDVYPPEATVRAMRARLETLIAQEPVPTLRGRRHRFWVVGLAAAAACLCVVTWLAVAHRRAPSTQHLVESRPEAVRPPIEGPAVAPAPEPPEPTARVALLTGALDVERRGHALEGSLQTSLLEGDRLGTRAEGSTVVAFGEGARVALGPETSIELRRLTTSARTISLSAGRIACEVAPHRGEELEVSTTEATIVVVGTQFAVEVGDTGEVEVRVVEGRVAVTSPSGAVIELEGGQRGRFPGGRVEPLAERMAARDAALLRGEVVATAEPRAPVDLGELFRRAEEARRQGSCSRATHLYERIIAAGGSGASAGTAQISLGQLCLGACRCPGTARRAFRSYLSGHGGAMREEAFVGLIRAERALGHQGAARATAQRYLSENPQGRYAAMARELVGAPP